MRLANSFTLGTLSTNVGLPTEMWMKFIQIYPEIGKNNRGKILLMEFNTATHSFSYINNTVLNNRIECQCITSWSTAFTSSTTVVPECWLRSTPQGSFGSYFAITVDVDVSQSQNLMCYFPEWVVTAGTLQATAKLINQGSSFPPALGATNSYGGLQQVTSNTLTFSTSPAVSTLTLSETPSLYASIQYVNTVRSPTYVLTLTLSTGSILNPTVYMNFQKGGLIPDKTFCDDSSVFLFCRVYNTYRNIIVAQFITNVNVNSVSFTQEAGSDDLLFPKHK